MNNPYIIKKPLNEHSYRELVSILLENITPVQRQKILERLTKINQRELDKITPKAPKIDLSVLKKYSLQEKMLMFSNVKSQILNNDYDRHHNTSRRDEHNDYFSQ
jgi:hypothetical protein